MVEPVAEAGDDVAMIAAVTAIEMAARILKSRLRKESSRYRPDVPHASHFPSGPASAMARTALGAYLPVIR
jgi:hypothetical protein